MGPHPYPWMVREFQRVVGDEARQQCRLLLGGADPDYRGRLRRRRLQRGRAPSPASSTPTPSSIGVEAAGGAAIGTGTKNATITVSNTAFGGTAGPVTLTAAPSIAKTSGTGNGTFSITGGTCVSGSVINAGSSCTINVRYSGQTNTSTANAAVTITDTGTSTTSQTTAAFSAN